MGKEKKLEIEQKILAHVEREPDMWRINAEDLYYRDLNSLVKSLSKNGVRKIEIQNVHGQRYIGTDIERMELDIHGTAGNDLGAFMNGSKLVVHGNVQDGCGNTMNDGYIVVHGRAGDITGYSMRGGKIFIRDSAGYRVGIHMKEYGEKKPCLVVGGTVQDFAGEYMAGGVLLVLGLGLKRGERHRAAFVGTGMHGGTMYIRGGISHIGNEVEIKDVDEKDICLVKTLIKEFCNNFEYCVNEVMTEDFTKIVPVSHRPYGTLYAY